MKILRIIAVGAMATVRGYPIIIGADALGCETRGSSIDTNNFVGPATSSNYQTILVSGTSKSQTIVGNGATACESQPVPFFQIIRVDNGIVSSKLHQTVFKHSINGENPREIHSAKFAKPATSAGNQNKPGNFVQAVLSTFDLGEVKKTNYLVMVDVEAGAVAKLFSINQVMGGVTSYPKRDDIQFKSFGQNAALVSSYSAYWISSTLKTKFECFQIKHETNQLQKIMIDPTSTHFFDKFGATSLLIFDDHVVLGGNVKISDYATANLAETTKSNPTVKQPLSDGINYHPILVHANSNLDILKSFMNKGYTHSFSMDILTHDQSTQTVFAYNVPRVPAYSSVDTLGQVDFRPFAYLIRYFYKGTTCSQDIIIQEFKQPQPGHWLYTSDYYLPLSFMPDPATKTLSVIYFKQNQADFTADSLRMDNSAKGSIFVSTFFLDVQCSADQVSVTYKGQTKLWSQNAGLGFDFNSYSFGRSQQVTSESRLQEVVAAHSSAASSLLYMVSTPKLFSDQAYNEDGLYSSVFEATPSNAYLQSKSTDINRGAVAIVIQSSEDSKPEFAMRRNEYGIWDQTQNLGYPIKIDQCMFVSLDTCEGKIVAVSENVQVNVDKNQGQYVFSGIHPEQRTIASGFTDWASLGFSYSYSKNLTDFMPGVSKISDLFRINSSKCKIKQYRLTNPSGDIMVSLTAEGGQEVLKVNTMHFPVNSDAKQSKQMKFDLEAIACGGFKTVIHFTVDLGCFSGFSQLTEFVKCEDCSSPFGTRQYDKTYQTVLQNNLVQQCSDVYPSQLCTELQTSSTVTCFDKFSFQWCRSFFNFSPPYASTTPFKLVIPSLNAAPLAIQKWSFKTNMWLSQPSKPGCYAQQYEICTDSACLSKINEPDLAMTTDYQLEINVKSTNLVREVYLRGLLGSAAATLKGTIATCDSIQISELATQMLIQKHLTTRTTPVTILFSDLNSHFVMKSANSSLMTLDDCRSLNGLPFITSQTLCDNSPLASITSTPLSVSFDLSTPGLYVSQLCTQFSNSYTHRSMLALEVCGYESADPKDPQPIFLDYSDYLLSANGSITIDLPQLFTYTNQSNLCRIVRYEVEQKGLEVVKNQWATAATIDSSNNLRFSVYPLQQTSIEITSHLNDGRKGSKTIQIQMDPCRQMTKVKYQVVQGTLRDRNQVQVIMDKQELVDISQHVRFELGRKEATWPTCYPYKYRVCRDIECKQVIVEEIASPLKEQPKLITTVDLTHGPVDVYVQASSLNETETIKMEFGSCSSVYEVTKLQQLVEVNQKQVTREEIQVSIESLFVLTPKMPGVEMQGCKISEY